MIKNIFYFYPELKKLIPYDKSFITKNFNKTFSTTRTLSFSNKSNIEDFITFQKLIKNNIGKKFYPIMRISDGEFLLLTGTQNESRREKLLHRIFFIFKNFLKKLILMDNFLLSSHIYGNFDHTTGTSETYKFKRNNISRNNLKLIKSKFLNEIKNIASKGILAIHYSYSEKPSLAEKFWLKFSKILKNHSVTLSHNNCFPFYFVYMLLSDKNIFHEIIKNMKILCVSSADGEKRENIIDSLKSQGAAVVDWLTIPTSKTFFYKIPKNNLDNYDLILLAAGTGKTNIINQLEFFNCPVIDCGYYFEVWNNSSMKYNRIGCFTDDEI